MIAPVAQQLETRANVITFTFNNEHIISGWIQDPELFAYECNAICWPP
jgi:hypothetical protein